MTKITIDRSVVEQALEALRCVDLQSLVPDYGSGHYSVARLNGPQVKSAITAMEAALAEPSDSTKPVAERPDSTKSEAQFKIEDERAAFEAWIGDNERGPTGYKTYTTEIAWRAWIYRAAAALRSKT